jgi:hypothetical protein
MAELLRPVTTSVAGCRPEAALAYFVYDQDQADFNFRQQLNDL